MTIKMEANLLEICQEEIWQMMSDLTAEEWDNEGSILYQFLSPMPPYIMERHFPGWVVSSR